MTICMRTFFATTTVVSSLGVFAAAQHPAMPAGMTHEQHQAQMNKDAELKRRGAAAMGFEQDATTHHFRLRQDGGTIEVEAVAAGDTAVRDAVRKHLREIAQSFADGDFAKPFATHGEVPPGASEMARLKTSIAYRFED